MPIRVGRSTSDGHRGDLDRLVRALEANRLPALTQAMTAVLTARDYNDPTLVRSALNEASLTLAEATSEDIRGQHELVGLARDVCRGELDGLTGKPAEDCDKVGRSLEAFLTGLIKVFEDTRDQLVRSLLDRGYEVRHVEMLARDIESLHALKREILGNWPWSAADVAPPLNRAMVEASRETIAAGRAERADDVINRLGAGRAHE